MKKCSKCGNEKLIEGIKYCLQCGADVEDAKANKQDCCCAKEKTTEDGKSIVKTRLSVELFEIF